MDSDTIQIVNVRDYGGIKQAEAHGVIYIGRPTILGNPFVVNDACSRDEAVKSYRKYLWQQIQNKNKKLIEAILSIKEGSQLGCWCKPLACHGDILVRAWEYLKNGD